MDVWLFGTSVPVTLEIFVPYLQPEVHLTLYKWNRTEPLDFVEGSGLSWPLPMQQILDTPFWQVTVQGDQIQWKEGDLVWRELQYTDGPFSKRLFANAGRVYDG